jgi:type I pantothenate kinase
VYDVVPGVHVVVVQPDILIVEGLNILQPGAPGKAGTPILYASDFLDFSIYIDADPEDLEGWYMDRFFRLRETAFKNPDSFFKRYADMSKDEAGKFGLDNWRSINLPNLRDNIAPTRSRADLILKKGSDHLVEQVLLRLV